MIARYFYDTDGKRLENKEENFHEEIAQNIINSNPELQKEYNEIRKKGIISESVFLVMKGYIYVGGREDRNYMGTMYSSISLNENTKNILSEMKEEGHYSYDIIREELTGKQKDQIRSWYGEGKTKNEIINLVMTEMLTLLSPTKKEDVGDEER